MQTKEGGLAQKSKFGGGPDNADNVFVDAVRIPAALSLVCCTDQDTTHRSLPKMRSRHLEAHVYASVASQYEEDIWGSTSPFIVPEEAK